jgi:DNA-binding MarR family transcriptional regulator
VPTEPSGLDKLGLAIKRTQWRHHRALDRRISAVGISLVQWDALRQIDLNPGASMHLLAELTFQSDQSFGTLATRLIDRGLVARQAGAGRKQLHVLTERGKELLEAGRAVQRQVMSESFAPLNRNERATLLSLLERLEEQTSGEASP